MSDPEARSPVDPFEAVMDRVPPEGDVFVVNVDGFEGPLDILLTMARDQKVDLARISILALVEQYLTFIAAARRLKIELAADYLVMAAWLAYLKSRLLLPQADTEEAPSGEEMAARLAFRLRKLEAMRTAGAALMRRPRLGRQVFARGAPEAVSLRRRPQHVDTLFDLLKAYGAIQRRQAPKTYEPRRIEVLSLEEARARLERMLGALPEWVSLQGYLAEVIGSGAEGPSRSKLASTFLASLELAREGHLELRQLQHFGTLYVRARTRGEDREPAPISGEA